MIDALDMAQTLTCRDFLPHLSGPQTTCKPQASEVPWGGSVILDAPQPPVGAVSYTHLTLPTTT